MLWGFLLYFLVYLCVGAKINIQQPLFLMAVYMSMLSLSSLLLPGIAYFFYKKFIKGGVVLTVYFVLLLGGFPYSEYILILFNFFVYVDIYSTYHNCQKKTNYFRFFIFLLLNILIFWAVMFVGCRGILYIGRVASGSMSPELHVNDHVVINRFSFLKNAPQRGDVIAFTVPSNTGRYGGCYAIKRIAAGSGDKVYWKDGIMFVNDTPYKASEIEQAMNPDMLSRFIYSPYNQITPYIVPTDYVFGVGDNYSDSYDSRHFGSVSKKAISGKVVSKNCAVVP